MYRLTACVIRYHISIDGERETGLVGPDIASAQFARVPAFSAAYYNHSPAPIGIFRRRFLFYAIENRAKYESTADNADRSIGVVMRTISRADSQCDPLVSYPPY